MEGLLKKSTAVNVTVLMIDSSDHITGKTGLSAGLTIYASKAGGSPATITPTVTELDATNVKGLYKLAFTTAHTDTDGEFQLHVTGAGADPTDVKWQVGAVDANLIQILGTLLTETAGQIAAGFKKVFDVAAPVFTAASVNQTGDNYARIGAPAGASVSADNAAIKAALPTALAADGSIKASVQSFLGTAFTEGAAGRIAAAFKQFFNIATPASTMDALTLVATATNLTNAPTAGDFTATMKTSLNAATPAVTVSDKTGFSLTAAYDAAKTAAQAGTAMTLTAGERTAIANEVEAQIIDDTDSEKVLKAITDKIASVNPDLGTLTLSAIAASVWAYVTRRLTDGNNIVLAKGVGVTGFNDLNAAQVNAEADTAIADAALATAATLATAQGDLDDIQTRLPAALIGGRMNASAEAVAVGAINAGAIAPDAIGASELAADAAAEIAAAVRAELAVELGRVDVTVGSRLPTTSYVAPDNAGIAAVPTAAQNADKLLGRNLAGGSDGVRTVQDALRLSRNRRRINAGVLQVYAEDDTTIAWSAPVMTAAGDPLVEVDPA